MPSTSSSATIGAQMAASSPQYVIVSGPGVPLTTSSSAYATRTMRRVTTWSKSGIVARSLQAADPAAVAICQVAGPDRLRAQRAALREVLVDAALGAVDGWGDLLGERLERLGEQPRVPVDFVDVGMGMGVVFGSDQRLLAGLVASSIGRRPGRLQGTIV